MISPHQPLWLILVVVSLTAACSSFPAEKGSAPTAMPDRATATQPAQATPAPKLQLGKLAFVKGGDVWVKDLPDGEAVQLTKDGTTREPRWSASGRWISFSKDTVAGPEVWIMQEDGRNAHRLDAPPVSKGVWSSVRDEMAYGSNGGLNVVNADGSGRRELLPPVGEDAVRVGAARLAWSPDGARIAFEKGDPAKPGPPYQAPSYQGLWLVEVDGSGAREVFANADLVGYQSYLAGWTPDGNSLLYWEGRYMSASMMADGLPLMQVPLAGGKPTQVNGTKTLVHPELLDWSRDGRLATVDGGYRNSWERKQIAVAEPGRLSILSDDGRSDLFPAWSPDGRLIAFTSGPAAPGEPGGDPAKQAMAERHIWLMQPDGSGKLQISKDSSFRDERPLWSADRSHILFGRVADERLRLWLMRSDGSEERSVVEELGSPPKPGQPIWFGYYGYIDWASLYDWWQEKPARPAPSSQQGEPTRLGRDAWAEVRTALPASVRVYKPDSLTSLFGPAVLEEVENDAQYGPRYTVVYQRDGELVAFILGMGKGALGNSPPPDSTEPITVHGELGVLSMARNTSAGSLVSQMVSWRGNGLSYQIKVFSNRITKDEVKGMVERLVQVR